MELTENIDNNKSEIFLKGALSIQDVSQIHEKILVSLQTTEHLTINLSEITSIDLAVVQVIHSSKETAKNWSKSFQIDGTESEEFCKQIAELGFEKYSWN